ncbi:MAG: peptidylprolyl isomerase [Chitinophagaceae bacterium]|nr:peptidylprolyl isomerase [Chitinophagaceae bacterium]
MKQALIIILLVSGFLSASAQSKRVVADKIIAQVGDKIILHSDITNAISDIKRQAQGQEGAVIPTECQILEGQLIQKALVLQAMKDSLTANDDDIENDMENRIRKYIASYGSKEVLEEIAGKTVYQMKEDFRDALKEQKLAEQMRGKIVDNIKMTPTEVKAYYSKTPKDSLPFYESEIEVSQIVIQPKANKDVEEYVSKQLYDYKKQVESGAKKFEQLVKFYSEDPGKAENGGQYNLNRNDKNMWDPAFLSGAFRLKEGQISGIIKSKFGLHIIQMVSRAGDDAVVRHILRIPPVAEEEINEAKTKLDSIRAKLVDGSLSFGAAVNKFSDDEGSKFSAGSISGRDGSTLITLDQVDKEMVIALKDMKPGSFSKPQVYTDERGGKKVRIIYLKTRTEPHRENLKEDYNRIASRALEDKKTVALEKWFKEHIPTYYISIDKQFSGCAGLEEWRKASKEQK